MTPDDLLVRIQALPRAARLALYRAVPAGTLAAVFFPNEVMAVLAKAVEAAEDAEGRPTAARERA